ncbi:hypothetical protein FHW84_002249 [Dyella sp. SG562]|uniref:hypothetical protein n=1 Tax=Dyella sp. SG562 TaxID=2587017 RepID=UPI00142325DD|nr:hypothetical protein [Dyella sp. SG562]NII73676.1 hypothetical protein [Dyella sp. SG562]
MRPTSSHLLFYLCIVFGFAVALPARADIVLEARQVAVPGLRLQDVQMRIAEDGNGGLQLTLRAAKAELPVLGWRRVGLDMQGALSRDPHLRWLFDGDLRLAGAPGGAWNDAKVNLVLDDAANTLQVDVNQGKSLASAALPLDQPTHAQISLKGLPAGWLQGLLATMWSGRATAGRLDAELALDVQNGGVQASGQFGLAELGFDTPSGTLAGQRLNGSGRLNVDTIGGPARIGLDASLRGGELLLGPIYARLPDHPVQLGLDASARNGVLDFSRLRVGDADALQLDGSLAFDAKGELQKLKLDRFQASFPAAYQRYGQAWLATMGLRNARISGQLAATLDMAADGLRAFSFDTDGLDIADGDGRLALSGVRGGMDWALRGTRPATTLSWRSAQVYRLAHGAAQTGWQSRDGSLGLQKAVDVPLLGGRLHVADLDWRPAAARGRRLSTSLALTGVDMAAFSRAMGWPEFPGTLGGAIPALRWVDDRIELEGGLSMNVFDGFVDVTRMSLQDPFGNSPVLAGDLALRQLDLGAITSVFDIGSITGRMDGSVQNLRLVNWNPVSFDARLLAGSGGRISQRAVNSLVSVGGGGIAAGLQGAMLRLFKNFSYKRIGLNCALQGTVCRMSGLDSDGDGYTIVEGSGLPRLQVVGHQTQVDWPTLVRRLKSAAESGGPEVH